MKIDEIKNLKDQIKVLKQSHESQQKLIGLQELVISKLEQDLRHEKDLYNNLLSSYDKQQDILINMKKILEKPINNECLQKLCELILEGLSI